MDTRAIQSDLVNDIYRNLYGLDTTVHYIFRLMLKNYKLVNKLDESHNIYTTNIRMDNATRIFDTRKIENYQNLRRMRFYEKS